MKSEEAIRAVQDPERLAVLKQLNLLDTPAEEALDRLTRLASMITDSPISLVSLIDSDRQFFKSQFGLPEPFATVRKTPLTLSFCKHVVAENMPLVVENAVEHPDLKDNPAIRVLDVHAYLGMPLSTSDGYSLGSFCVIDTRPRVWTDREIEIVRELARSVMVEIELTAQISAREQADLALQLSEIRTRMIIDSALDAVVFIDNDSSIIEWNPQAEETFGWTRDEILGKKLFDTIIPHDFRDGHRAGMIKHQETGVGPILGKRIEIVGLHRSGSTFPIELTVSPAEVEGNLTYSAFVRDITNQKKTQAELLQAKEVAEEAAMAKTTFLANMSHEIRTPLNSIIGLTSLLLDTQLDPEEHAHIRTIYSSGHTLLEIINNILDYTKLEADKMTLEKTPFSIRRLMREVREMLIHQANVKGIKLEYAVEPGIPNVFLGDVTRLRQILINLVTNGIKFTAQGFVAFKVRATSTTEDSCDLEFSVEDTGIGIQEELLDKMFSPFTQLDASTTRKYGGSGLGLSICRQLVERMDGRIWVESEVGTGTVMRFTLRLSACANSEVEDSLPEPSADKTLGIVHPLRIVVAEDEPVNQLVAAKMLERLGYTSGLVSNGLELLNAVRAAPYDVVLMDIQMPEMDGITATNVIRSEYPSGQRPRIIAVTANALAGDRERFIALGMDDYVSKPLLIDALASALQRTPRITPRTAAHPPEAPLALDHGADNLVAAADGSGAIDVGLFESRMGSDSLDLLNTLVALFTDEAPSALAQLRQAVDEGHVTKSHQVIHKLKGSSAGLAATRFSDLCQELLVLLHDHNQVEPIKPYLPLLENAMKEIEIWADQHRT